MAPNGNGKRRKAPKKKQPQQKAKSKGPPALEGIQQGVGGIAKGPFNVSLMPRAPSVRGCVAALDAFKPGHLALPRAVGEYTVCRTTLNLASNNAAHFLVGTFQRQGGKSDLVWAPTAVIYPQVGSSGAPINTNVNFAANYPIFVTPTGYDSCTLVPSALSVQILNPEAVQTSAGTVYVGRWKTQPAYGGNASSWDTVGGEFINNNAPRLLAAARLAFRGVQIDAVPFNMNALAQFTELSSASAPIAGPFPWDNTSAPNASERLTNIGFAPICILNPNGIGLTLLVTCEWRVRFPPNNPAQSSHSHHPVHSDSVWDKTIAAMHAMGHGVRDISAMVAVAGELAGIARTAGALMA